MSSSKEEVAVFIDTNFGTRIVVVVYPDITAGDFQKELERMHFNCFPKIGEIKVYGLRVKQKSNFYHLHNSVPIKHVFQGLKGTRFLHVEAKPLSELDGSGLSQCIDAKVRYHNLNNSVATDSLITSTEKNGIISNGKKRRINGSHGTAPLSKELCNRKSKKEKRVESVVACNSSSLIENRSEKPSKAVPAGCVKRCLSNFSNVSKLGSPPGGNATAVTFQNHLQKQLKAKRNSTRTSVQINALPELTVKTLPRTSSLPLSTNSRLRTSRNTPGKTINSRLGKSRKNLQETYIGKRLVEVSKKICIYSCKSSDKNGKLLNNSASAQARYSVFDF